MPATCRPRQPKRQGFRGMDTQPAITAAPQRKPRLSFWQIWNMSFGFLGIQFGFALQGGFMSRIFQTLGAEKDALPLLWIAAPLTGLLVQPLVGYLSDRTWHPFLGRRRPYFLDGRSPELDCALLRALLADAVDRSRLPVGAGCLDQHQHGALPRTGSGQAARRTALLRFRAADLHHRHRHLGGQQPAPVRELAGRFQ